MPYTVYMELHINGPYTMCTKCSWNIAIFNSYWPDMGEWTGVKGYTAQGRRLRVACPGPRFTHPYQVKNNYYTSVWCCIFFTKLSHIDSSYLVGLERLKVLEKAKSIDIIMCHNKMIIGSEFANVNIVKNASDIYLLLSPFWSIICLKKSPGSQEADGIRYMSVCS